MKHSAIYPFVRYDYPDKSFRESVDLPVRVLNPHTGSYLDTWAKLDTGADACVIPRVISDKLGHLFNGDGVKSEVTNGVSGPTATCKHTFEIQLFDHECKNLIWSSGEVLVDCIDTDGLPPLIGVDSFLEVFEVKINYPSKMIMMSWD